MIYMAMLFTGAIFFIFGLKKSVSSNRVDSILNSHTTQRKVKDGAPIDIPTIIIEGSPTLTFIKKIDDDLTTKIKLVACIAAPIFLLTSLNVIGLSYQDCLMVTVLIFIGVIVIPSILISINIKKGMRSIGDTLPYFIELVAVCIQTGMTVESAIKYVAQRFGHMDKSLASIMDLVARKAEVSGMEDALTELYESIDLAEMKMFCSNLQQSVHYGTSLYDNLLQLSQDIRELQLLNMEEKIGKLSAKMSIPLILFIMFPITVLITAPGILRIIKNGIF
ncbi:type II secretion system F family protein [Apirhabdus apintestini]|uniref:type II secretion system F family protein n=1 Tax=Erwinia sp. HR93 TaxID=3094840 RepID=UPI002ADEF025|nr:type II secretion system F family protein [Erwinia sp. HR93]MEA1062996.1 type II secretion system F family protein [Erwinia sp. HR93]WPM84883.1 type II secretion system F family protein [Enterobacteriaceae bacterium CA-0114]